MMLPVAAAAASIAAVAFSPAAAEPNLVEAPSTVRIRHAVSITVIGKVAKHLRLRGEKLVVVLQPTAHRGQDGRGAVPSALALASTSPGAAEITFPWPAFDNACSRTHCVKVRWRVNRRVDINVCAGPSKDGVDACARTTAVLRQ
jgi:hypothetical protein